MGLVVVSGEVKSRGLQDIPLVRHQRGIGDAPGGTRIRAISIREVRIRPKGLAQATRGGMWNRCSRFNGLCEVLKNLFDYRRIFDTGDHPDGAAALLPGLGIDLEYTFEALRPGHGGTALGGGFDLVGGLFTAPAGVTWERCWLLGANTP